MIRETRIWLSKVEQAKVQKALADFGLRKLSRISGNPCAMRFGIRAISASHLSRWSHGTRSMKQREARYVLGRLELFGLRGE